MACICQMLGSVAVTRIARVLWLSHAIMSAVGSLVVTRPGLLA